MLMSTKTEAGGSWLIEDEPTHFRRWGSNSTHPFPPTPGGGIIGAAEGCWLQLHDASGRVSRQHAQLLHHEGRWVVCDNVGSKNGIHHDGAKRPSVVLAPGVELGFGGVTLIAESPLLVTLRDVLSRLIGWSESRLEDVDLALRAVRVAATCRESLHICGNGDLVLIAQLLHRYTLGEQRPFVVCDPRRVRADASARAAANYVSGMEALSAATGGTLCIWQNRQPDDFRQVIDARRHNPSLRVQLVVCTHTLPPSAPLIASPVILPPLSERTSELDRIIDAYAIDAGATLGATATLTLVDREWVHRHEATSLASIERAVRRLIAIRKADGVVSHAAEELGMANATLSEWFARRTLEIGGDDDDDN
jgi:hypothetical protein